MGLGNKVAVDLWALDGEIRGENRCGGDPSSVNAWECGKGRAIAGPDHLWCILISSLFSFHHEPDTAIGIGNARLDQQRWHLRNIRDKLGTQTLAIWNMNWRKEWGSCKSKEPRT
jgi:hypothetical protein